MKKQYLKPTAAFLSLLVQEEIAGGLGTLEDHAGDGPIEGEPGLESSWFD